MGVAAAVNPDAFSSLSGAPQSQLNIGKSIFFNERINTTTSGLVQVLLVDGSTFTVGPGSDLVIDKFIYDPKKKTGEVVATFSKGVARFVGGKISKNVGGVTINTPAGALAIRGGMAQGNEKIWSFIYGSEMTFTGKNGQTTTVYEPGYTIDFTSGVPKVRPTTASDTNAFMNALTKGGTGGTGNTGNDGTNPPPKQALAETISLQDLISEANAQLVDDSIEGEEKAETPTDTTGDTTTDDTGTDTGTDTTPPPCEDCGGTPTGQIEGYAAGLYVQSPPDDGDPPVGVLANWNSKHVSFAPNADEETFSALFKLRVGEPGSNQGGADIKFGDAESNPQFPHSFRNQYGLAALSPLGGIKILHDDQTEAVLIEPLPIAVLASSGLFDDFDDSKNLSNVPDRPTLPVFCSECNFLKWGVFLAAASFEDSQNGKPIQRDVDILGWWVAGDIPAVGQLPVTGTASYSGDALATVATNLDTAGWVRYIATGKMGMSWNFGTRQGGFAIAKFDSAHFNGSGLTFSGPMCAPGVAGCGTNTPGGNHFGGPLSIANAPRQELSNLSGFALGSFVRGPNNFDNGVAINRSTPQGVIGNFGVGNDRYTASGIFGGAKQ